MWSFATPLVLMLLPLPFVARWLLPPREPASGAVFVPSAIASVSAAPAVRSRAENVQRVLPAVLWISLVVALAGPRMLTFSDAVSASGRDIVLAIDLSGSMENEDFDLDGEALTRLDAVKRVAAHFVRGRSGDRMGLVVFGDRAYFASPPTFDVEAVARAIEGAAIGVSGRSTAISDGLGLALKRLSKSDAPSRVVILLSDGVDTTGALAATDVADLAKDIGIRIHTVALGPQDLETAPDANDAVDTATLRAIAEKSDGTIFRVRTMKDLSEMAAALDRLEPSPTSRPPLEVQRELWIYPGIFALLIALSLVLMRRGLV